MTTTNRPPVLDPTALLAAYTDLPGAGTLLDAASLAAVHGHPLTLTRARLKPGASALVSHHRTEAASAGQASAPGHALSDVGWTLLIASRDKRDGALRRAARSGVPLTQHPSPAGGPYLLSGGLEADPRIGRTGHRVLSSLGPAGPRDTAGRHDTAGCHDTAGPHDAAGCHDTAGRRDAAGRHVSAGNAESAGSADGDAPRVLSFNPARHAVLHLPGSGQVLRLAARDLDGIMEVTRSWLALGVPTLEQRPWRGKSSVLIGEHWGDGDLAHHARHDQAVPAAAATGAALARLHGAALAADDLPEARLGAPVPAALEAITQLLPGSAGATGRLTRQLRGRLPTRPRHGLIHGDLTPDQVLVSLDPSAGPSIAPSAGPSIAPSADPSIVPSADPSPAQIRIIDLDRSGRGPLGADLGSWLASCLVTDTEELARAFLDGYAREGHVPVPEELAVWTARALVAAAADPIRRFHPDWPVAVARRLELAEEILAAPEMLPLPRAAAAGPAPLVPAQVVAGGAVWEVARAWPDDGRGLPLELRRDGGSSESGSTGRGSTAGGPATGDPAEGDSAGAEQLHGARLDPVTGTATVFAAGTDPRLPGLARCLAAHPEGHIVSHRPGKRAVLRIGNPGDPEGERYVKIVRPGRAGRLHDALTRASSFDGPFRLQREVAADEESSTTAALAGTTLHETLPSVDGTWRRAWRDTLLAWAEALAVAPAPVGGAAIHGPAEEIAVLETWHERAADVDPAGAAVRERALGSARRELSRLEIPPRPVLIHRDLHDKQILHAPGLAPGLLDVDTAAIGDPALDLANLRAHASWRERQRIWGPEHARIAREEIDAAALRGRIPAATLAAYEAGTLARLACVYAFRPRWRDLARSLAADLVPVPGDGASIPEERERIPDDPSTTPDERTVTS